MLYCLLLSFFYLDWVEFNAQFISVVGFSEIISIIYYTVSSENIDVFSDSEVSRWVELLFLQTHARIDSVYGFLWKFLSFEQQWERISAWILESDFFEFNTIVS